MGTALTAEQMALLARIARRVVVVFDGDGAGQRAAQKAVPMFVEAEVDARIARLPTGKDPDDYVRQPGGPAAFRKLLETARPMLDQFIQDAALDTTVPGRVATLESVAGLLIRVRNPTTRELYQRQLAAVLGVSAPQVVRAMREAQERRQERRPERLPEPRTERTAEDRPHAGSSPATGATAAARRGDAAPGPGRGVPGDGDGVGVGGGPARGEVAAADRAGSRTASVPAAVPADAPAPAPGPDRSLPRDELEVLVLLISYPELLATPEAGRASQLLIDGTVRQLCRQLGERAGRGEHVDVPALIEVAPPEARRSLAAALMDEAMSTAANPPSKLRALVARLELQRVEAEISMTWQLLAQARNRGDDSGATAIMKRGIELDQTKQGLKAALQRP
jgi:hypothetical protein